MSDVTVKINGQEVTVPSGTTILEAAHKAGFDIPTLCYMKDMNEIGACRICVVELKGARGLVTACVYPCDRDGMEIVTNSPRITEARRKNLQLLLSNHKKGCLACVRSGNCELMDLCRRYNVEDAHRYDGAMTPSEPDTSSIHLIRDNSKCILCRRCVAACKAEGIGVIGANYRGFKTAIGSPFDSGLAETSCIHCGQCIAACPTGALREKDCIKEVTAAINDPEKVVLVQTAPAVRAALGEAFGYPIGTDTQGKMAAALRRLGFDRVFDTDFGADLTIMEEANELLDRMKNGGVLPMITSCSPGWVKYCETYYPEMIPHLSTCKSPHTMFGAIAKNWWAKKNGVDPKNIVMVSVMPCTAKKFEITRSGEGENGLQDVDYVLTTRELSRMIKMADIRFRDLPEEGFDDPMGESTGAGVIFGATGGVMEAALRTAAEAITGVSAPAVEFKEVRGVKDIKEATYEVGGTTLHVCVTSGTANAGKVLDAVKKGEAHYDFIEVMACPGGCVNGGGQPRVPYSVRNFEDIRAIRAQVLYQWDKDMPLRKSHDNPSIKKLYDDFLGQPGSETAHHLLHTTYVERSVNKKFD